MHKEEWYRGKFPPSLMEAVAMHTILYTLGFSLQDDVFIVPSAKQGLLVVLKKGDKEAVFRAGDTELAPEEMARLWEELSTLWNTGGVMGQPEKDQIVSSSGFYAKKANIIIALLAKGFQVTHRSEQQGKH